MMKKPICLFIFLSCFLFGFTQHDSLHAKNSAAIVVDTLRPGAFKTTGKPITGNATIYDLDFDGSKTASGEVFFNIRLTAASNDFKLNSWIKVTNPKNKKYVIVRVNDKLSSSQKKNGIALKLSEEAGKKIGVLKKNIVKVKIESISVLDSDSLNIATNDTTFKQLPDTLKGIDSLTPNSFKVIGKAVPVLPVFTVITLTEP